MPEVASWIAPVATMVAAVMTAANLGARVTGWGFVVFLLGSLAWCAVAVGTGQQNLLWTNGFLTLVNAVGIWRWLGRQARYEEGGETATRHSAASRVPDLFALGAIAGAKLTGPAKQPLGVVVEWMMRCNGAELAYLVVSEGGVGGVGERLHAVDPKTLRFSPDGIVSELTLEALRALPVLGDQWPVALARAGDGDARPARQQSPEMKLT